jgi:hypothetical protein
MGLNNYRSFKDNVVDDGEEVFAVVEADFSPDFKNRNTIQLWDVTAIANPIINKWKGTTLTDRTLHEVTIVNNGNTLKAVRFTSNFKFTDEEFVTDLDIKIGPNGSAHFYCTAILDNGNLVFNMRTGSQDKRKL